MKGIITLVLGADLLTANAILRDQKPVTLDFSYQEAVHIVSASKIVLMQMKETLPDVMINTALGPLLSAIVKLDKVLLPEDGPKAAKE